MKMIGAILRNLPIGEHGLTSVGPPDWSILDRYAQRPTAGGGRMLNDRHAGLRRSDIDLVTSNSDAITATGTR